MPPEIPVDIEGMPERTKWLRLQLDDEVMEALEYVRLKIPYMTNPAIIKMLTMKGLEVFKKEYVEQ